MIEIILPYPPTVNHYKVIGNIIKTSSGKVYQQRVNSPKTKRFMYQVWYLWKSIRPETHVEPIEDEIFLTLWVYPPDKRKRDLDNVLKVLLDSLQQAGVYKDDNQIVKLFVERKEVKIGGEVIVRIVKCC